jgi:hypothetical protein
MVSENHACTRPNAGSVSLILARAFDGLGLAVEYLAHRIKELAAPMCRIPVELTAMEVGPRGHGREMISIDISEYGDPLVTRAVRVPFSGYLKPWQQRWKLGEKVVSLLAPAVLLPIQELGVEEAVQVMHNLEEARRWAGHCATGIPDQSQAMVDLLDSYQISSLASFHQWFYSQSHHPPERWPETYDRLPMNCLPRCAQKILSCPNDLLLRPTGMARVVQVLLALGWHPRHIAGLIRSKFERDYGWGKQWEGYHPGMRADLYTRIFSGLFVDGQDELVDFNCQSAREAKTCFAENCCDNLEAFRQSLIHRRTYERLACWPFNRLFLPAEPPQLP